MRIVVVEDEPKSREGILNILSRNTNCEVAAVAENGLEGLKAVREYRPDLVISDIKMPVMGGLEMLEKIVEEGIVLQTILLTGYSDFEYARRALKLQVVEYVLKPLEVENFLEVLERVEGNIKKSRAQRVSPEQLLWTYLSGSQEESGKVEPFLKEALQTDERTQVSLFLISPCSLANETSIEMMKQTSSLLDNLCMENYYVFPFVRQQGYVVMLVDTERNRNLFQIFRTRVLHSLWQISECHCSYGVIYGLDELKAKIQELRDMIQYGFSLPEETIISRELVSSIQYKEVPYPDYLEQSMLREIRNGNYEKVLSIGEQFAQTVIDSPAKPACIREYVMRFAAGILRMSGEIRGNMEKENNASYIMENIARSTSAREVRYQLEKIMKAAANNEEEFTITENGMILNVIAFIRNNYQRDIALSEAAELCGVTPEYLCRIFNRETGVNFTSFLQNFRISTAKRLLLSGNYKIYEVSEMVGFHDQKYFVKIFKKLCGVTPSEFKRENCR